MNKTPTIFDTDPGIDDAFALSFLHKSDVFDVKMLSSVAGNVKLAYTTRNLQGLAYAMDWQVPIYKGLDKAILGKQILAEEFHGVNGLLGYTFNDKELADLKNQSAIKAMEKVLEENKKTLIIAVGPLTNIASLILSRPDLKEKISEITIMGGAVGMGNVTSNAEFNIFADPEAASIVFKSGIKINMLGLNVTTKTSYNLDMHEKFKKSDKKINKILSDIMDIRIKQAGSEENYTTYMHDTLAVMYHTNPEIFKSQMLHMDVETKGEFTRGMTVADLRINSTASKNINFVSDIDKEKFKEIFIKTLI
ncbi:MAG: nucleoside hydrolase [Anaerococcus sp.]|jgi:inosine/uridine-preferring nucleoside hydrolase|uniref:nucleoside hydrolase n=1 Tax=Anaerococcus sp. TaxID=1872515 RepID=UPI00290719CC|nr:nucleoside hydrolase [Anaerococcus sp.]MDU7412278.1 nucleoside hydrolase [Anaerococcus sp.]